MFDWCTEMAKQRQRELLSEAQQYRLLSQAYDPGEQRATRRKRALCALGTWLVAVGRWLQSRSGAAPASSGSLVFLAGRDTAGSRQSGVESLRKVA
jgi:hypothetical protein